MQHPNYRQEITPDLIQRLPSSLLLTWSTVQFLSQLNPTFALNVPTVTVDLLVHLLQNIAQEQQFIFCGFLCCRRCLRTLKSFTVTPLNEALLDYVTRATLRTPNGGLQFCTTNIPNSRVLPNLVIPNYETTSQILRHRGLPTFTSTASPPTHINQTQVINTQFQEVGSRTDPRPTLTSRRRRRSVDSLERLSDGSSYLGTNIQHGLSQSPPIILQFTQGSCPSINSTYLAPCNPPINQLASTKSPAQPTSTIPFETTQRLSDPTPKSPAFPTSKTIASENQQIPLNSYSYFRPFVHPTPQSSSHTAAPTNHAVSHAQEMSVHQATDPVPQISPFGSTTLNTTYKHDTIENNFLSSSSPDSIFDPLRGYSPFMSCISRAPYTNPDSECGP